MVSITSTASLASTLRRTVLETQNQIAKAQVEASTGRVSDLGLALGADAGRDFALGVRSADLASISNSNAVIAARLDSADTTLGTIAQTAQTMLETLVGTQSGAGSDAQALQSNAISALKSLVSALNTSVAGVYLFGGLNSSTPPVTDYFADPSSAASQGVEQAFVGAFGVSQSADDVANISGSQMQAFLTGDFANLFSSSSWSSEWSGATDSGTTNRISLSQISETSVSANDSSLRGIAMAYTMIADLGVTKLGTDAYQQVLTTAAETLGQSISGLTRLRASVGVMQKTVSDANEAITAQRNVLATQIGALENVDPYEASTRLNNLTTQLETSYTLTGKIQQLTLAKYL